jgi:hypothetical protein
MIIVYRLRQLIGLQIEASDGPIGRIKDVYFDDYRWTIRYLVVETGAFFAIGQVLISPIAVSRIDWDNNLVHVKLNTDHVKASPPIGADKPISRQHEADYFDHYGFPYYWTDPSLWIKAAYPIKPPGSGPVAHNMPGVHGEAPFDPRLCSAKEVVGYGIRSRSRPPHPRRKTQRPESIEPLQTVSR